LNTLPVCCESVKLISEIVFFCISPCESGGSLPSLNINVSNGGLGLIRILLGLNSAYLLNTTNLLLMMAL
jgi:hypothetical protein